MNATDPGQRSQRIGAVGWCRSIAGRCVGRDNKEELLVIRYELKLHIPNDKNRKASNCVVLHKVLSGIKPNAQTKFDNAGTVARGVRTCAWCDTDARRWDECRNLQVKIKWRLFCCLDNRQRRGAL